MKTNKYILICVTLAWALLIGAANSWAVPNLQIYSPDADYYDTASETWIINSYHYELWVIGAGKSVFDVKLAFAAPTDGDGTIAITSYLGTSSETTVIMTEDGGMDYDKYFKSYSGKDGSAGLTKGTYAFSKDGTPVMGDGQPLPPHGVFPASFYEYFIGDFGLSQTVQNYIPGPGLGDTANGEIMKFDILVTGYSWVDIVAYDHVVLGQSNAQYKFSPFSHDGSSATVPEPGTLLLLGSGLLGLGLLRRRRKS